MQVLMGKGLRALGMMLAMMLGTGRVQAFGTADEADLQFELGAGAYQAGRYLEALSHFLASHRLSPNQNVVFNIARAYERLGRFPEAYRYYQMARTLGGPKEDMERLERAMSVLAPHVAVLEVVTEPPGATVYLDRRELGSRGETPHTLGLEAGSYRLLVELPGYETAERELPSLALGTKTRVSIQLKPLLSELRLVSEVDAGLSVTAELGDRRFHCRLPCAVSLPPGPNTLKVRSPGHQEFSTFVDLVQRRRTTVDLRLERSLGNLRVETEEIGALIEVDGRVMGYSPAILSLATGEHRIVVSQPGFRSVERKVSVHEGKTVHLKETLIRNDEVISASRSAESARSAPSSVIVIPREELRLFAYPTVYEALRGAMGVFGSDDRAYTSIGLRGLGRLGSYGNRILVTLDDQTLNDDWLGSSYLGYEGRTDLSDVERIELTRGPGSALFGTGAFSGVVSLVSRRASMAASTEAGLGVASDNVGRLRLRQDLPLGPVTRFYASVGVAKSTGSEFVLPAEPPLTTVTSSRNNDRLETGTVQARLTHRDLSISAFMHSHAKHQPTAWFQTIWGDERAQQTDRRALFEARYEPEILPGLVSMSRTHLNFYGYRGSFPRLPAEGGLERDRFDGSWIGIEQRLSYSPSTSIRLTSGGEGQHHFSALQTAKDEITTYLEDRRAQSWIAGYGLADLFLPRTRLSLGGRVDAYSTFGTSLSPRAAVVVEPYASGTSKLILGKAFRAPSIYELYYSDGGITQLASPDLGPEELWSASVEHSHEFHRHLSVTGGAFLTRVTDMVTQVGGGNRADPLRYENRDEPLSTFGLELRLRREWSQGYMFECNYTWTSARFLRSESWEDQLSFRESDILLGAINVPEHLAAVKLAVPIVAKTLRIGSRLSLDGGRLSGSEVRSQSVQRTDAFVSWDLVASGDVLADRLAYSLGLYNVFDQRVALPVSAEFPRSTFPQQGRSLLLEASYRF